MLFLLNFLFNRYSAIIPEADSPMMNSPALILGVTIPIVACAIVAVITAGCNTHFKRVLLFIFFLLLIGIQIQKEMQRVSNEFASEREMLLANFVSPFKEEYFITPSVVVVECLKRISKTKSINYCLIYDLKISTRSESG